MLNSASSVIAWMWRRIRVILVGAGSVSDAARVVLAVKKSSLWARLQNVVNCIKALVASDGTRGVHIQLKAACRSA